MVCISLVFMTFPDRFARQGVGPFSNIKRLTHYKDNSEDPYITLKDVCASLDSDVTIFISTSGR